MSWIQSVQKVKHCIATLLTPTSMSGGERKVDGPKRNGKNKPAKRQGGASSCAPKANKVEEHSRKRFSIQ